jgi:ADP-ribose pyrophosphatase YjhB (NUDIX family)
VKYARINKAVYKVIVKGWIKKGDKFLLAQRGSKEAHHAGVWSLPGGNVESNIEEYALESTLKREIKEEIGVEVEDRMVLIFNNSFVKESDGSKVMNLTFLTEWKSGAAQALEDTSDVKWLTLEELNQLSDLPSFLVNEIQALTSFITK